MSQHDAVYLEKTDLIKLKSKMIGKGTDGSVYDVGNGFLYKIYHDESCFSDISVEHPFLDGFEDEDIKIAQKGAYAFMEEVRPYFSYVDAEGVRIRGDKVIYLALEKQKDVKLTQLPLAPIYVDSRFKGCVLRKHNLHLQIHSLMGLPKWFKSKVLVSVCDSVEELLYNYIYHLDLANYPDELRKVSHSNVLVSLGGKTQLIDVDGKSAIYCEVENLVLYEKCLRSLNDLVLKFYFNIDVPDEVFDADIDMMASRLEQQCVKDEYISDLLELECDISTLRKVLKK